MSPDSRIAEIHEATVLADHVPVTVQQSLRVCFGKGGADPNRFNLKPDARLHAARNDLVQNPLDAALAE